MKPRKTLFTPVDMVGAPPKESISSRRRTEIMYVTDMQDTIEDNWHDENRANRSLASAWTGRTIFDKLAGNRRARRTANRLMAKALKELAEDESRVRAEAQFADEELTVEMSGVNTWLGEAPGEEELKTTQTVELDEVRAELESWKEPIHSEVSSLYSSGAVVLVESGDVRGFLAEHPGTPILPGKGGLYQKAGSNRS